jgi:ribonuclease P protein component
VKSPRLSLRKTEILRGYQTFSRIITEGRSLQKGAIRCFFAMTQAPAAGTRVGFSVSRSVRNAVERNRARRWMKEAYRKNKYLLDDASGESSEPLDVVFMVRVRDRLSRARGSHAAIDQAMIALLKELHQHRLEKP